MDIGLLTAKHQRQIRDAKRRNAEDSEIRKLRQSHKIETEDAYRQIKLESEYLAAEERVRHLKGCLNTLVIDFV